MVLTDEGLRFLTKPSTLPEKVDGGSELITIEVEERNNMVERARLARLATISFAIILAFALAFSFSQSSVAYADATVDNTLTVNALSTGTSISKAKVSVKGPVYYNGKAKKPKITVKIGTKTLRAGTDYSIKFSNNTKPGKAKVTITGKGRYKGTKTVYFKILKSSAGWHKINGKLYLYKSNGLPTKGAWAKRNGYWTYLSKKTGAALKGWFKVGKYWYYANSKWQMQTGWKKLPVHWYDKSDHKWHLNKNARLWYYFDSSGAMLKGWQYIGGAWYFFHKTDGDMYQNGAAWIDNLRYYFNSSGAMHTGWLHKNGYWYYFSSSGWQCAGWNRIDGTWYYFAKTSGNGDAFMLHSGWYRIDGKSYLFDSSGRWIR